MKTFILHDDQAWRVPAYMLLMRRLESGEWSDALESLASELLGYTEEQISRWLSFHRHRQLGWRGMTLCFLLTEEQRSIIEGVGCTSIPCQAFSPSLTVFVPRGFFVIARDADKIAREHRLTVARAAVRYSFGSRLIGASGKDPVSVESVAEPMCREFNSSLYSKIQVFGDGQWS